MTDLRNGRGGSRRDCADKGLVPQRELNDVGASLLGALGEGGLGLGVEANEPLPLDRAVGIFKLSGRPQDDDLIQ